MEEEIKNDNLKESGKAEAENKEAKNDAKKEEIMTKADIQAKIDDIKGKVMILEWDKEKNQLNVGKAVYLKKLKEELISLQEKLK
jgi:hypothetical protein